MPTAGAASTIWLWDVRGIETSFDHHAMVAIVSFLSDRSEIPEMKGDFWTIGKQLYTLRWELILQLCQEDYQDDCPYSMFFFFFSGVLVPGLTPRVLDLRFFLIGQQFRNPSCDFNNSRNQHILRYPLPRGWKWRLLADLPKGFGMIALRIRLKLNDHEWPCSLCWVLMPFNWSLELFANHDDGFIYPLNLFKVGVFPRFPGKSTWFLVHQPW